MKQNLYLFGGYVTDRYRAKGLLDKTIDDTWYKDKDYHTMYIAKITKILAR